MGGRGEEIDASRFLPLTDLTFNVVVALADQERHGYALIKELRTRTGRERLRTGTVYAALARLQDDGLVEEAGERASSSHSDERRRYYRATALGLAAARAEVARLTEVLGIAREKDLTPEPSRG